MSIYMNGINNNIYNAQNVRFAASKNVSYSGTPIDTIVDKIEEEKEKKHNKAAVTAGAVVIGVVALLTLLRPKYSGNFSKKLQEIQAKMLEKVHSTKNNKFLNKIYKFCSKVTEQFVNVRNFLTNFNPIKDIWFKKFCTEGFKFSKVENYQTRKKLQNIDQKRASFTGKIHKGVTNCFDKLGQYTVKQGYKKSSKKFDKLEGFIRKNLDKLSDEDAKFVTDKLAEIKSTRTYYNEQNIVERMQAQESLMKNLEKDFKIKSKQYIAGFRNKWVKNGQHFVQNLYYWPEKIVMPARDKLERNGLDVVEKLVGNGAENKGAYNEIIDLLSKKLDSGGKDKLGKLYKKADKALRKANGNECVDYFGKKRDLVMGSAPTDVVTAVTSLGIAGAALASADDKNQRISRLVTGAIPAVGGVGVSLAMTSMLVSGGKALMIGFLSSFILNRIGTLADKYLLGNKEHYEKKSDKKENVVYA